VLHRVWLVQALKNVLPAVSTYNKHIIFTGHSACFESVSISR
jgi:hypothetical protein